MIAMSGWPYIFRGSEFPRSAIYIQILVQLRMLMCHNHLFVKRTGRYEHMLESESGFSHISVNISIQILRGKRVTLIVISIGWAAC